LGPPATETALGEIERTTGQPLPVPLSELLRECDGVRGPYEDVVWDAAEIARRNAQFRTEFGNGADGLYMPFEPLLFFGDNGGGDQFAFPRIPLRDAVFVWDHETDGRHLVARSLESYVRQALEGSGGDWYR
jgi:hypothetical protein